MCSPSTYWGYVVTPSSSARACRWCWVGETHCAPRSTTCPAICPGMERPPTRSSASSTTTDAPSRSSFLAAVRPAKPAPTTTTSTLFVMRRLLALNRAARRLRRRRLAAGVHEALVDDLPGAVDPRQREVVDEGHRPPEAFLGEGHQCDVIVLLDGRDFCLVAAVDVHAPAFGQLEQLGDRLVVALAQHAAPHARVGVEHVAQLRDVTISDGFLVLVDRPCDLLGLLSRGGHGGPSLTGLEMRASASTGHASRLGRR